MSGTPPPPSGQDPLLLRRLLRARDRMDALSHEDWPVPRLAAVSGVSEAQVSTQGSYWSCADTSARRRVDEICCLIERWDIDFPF